MHEESTSDRIKKTGGSGLSDFSAARSHGVADLAPRKALIISAVGLVALVFIAFVAVERFQVQKQRQRDDSAVLSWQVKTLLRQQPAGDGELPGLPVYAIKP